MKVLTLFAAFLIFLSGNAFAATLQWDRNTETDMKEYHVYACTTSITCVVQHNVASRIGVVPQPAVGVIPKFVLPNGVEGRVAVDAVDTAGNESVLSVQVPFDSKAPVVPGNLHLVP